MAKAIAISGFDLATKRRELGLTQEAIAKAWGVKRQRVATVERERLPTEDAVSRYLGALAALKQDRSIVRLADLTPAQRRLIEALLAQKG